MLLTMGVEAIARGGNREGIPFFPFFLFGLVGLFGGIGDFRRMRSAPPRGGVRIARHLWRMCFALFIAAMSFFIGQADVFPKPWRIMPLLALPPFSVLGAMLYWVWRVRVRRSVRGLVGVPVTEDALRGSS
jgi:peptidoglycan/LPS O-acetylase OafA/YrhL